MVSNNSSSFGTIIKCWSCHFATSLAQDPCQGNPCTNGGKCVTIAPTVFSCSCPVGFTGTYCQTDIDECASSPCQNGGICTDQVGGYFCVCRQNFSGPECQNALTIDPCQSNPCLNGGTCLAAGPTSLVCVCDVGYTGNYCQTDIDECASSPCQNGGICTDEVASFSCYCPSSFLGKYCEHDIDECLSSPCQHGGTCVDEVGGFSCVCPLQFSGPACQQAVRVPDITSKLLEGSNSSLTVNCSFPGTPVGQVQTLLSLIVTRKPLTYRPGDEESELASIHIEHPTQVNLLAPGATTPAPTVITAKPSGTAAPSNTTGHINPILGSVLSLTWLSPNSTEEGIYGCVARGLDSLGHLVTLTSSRLVKRSSDLDRFRNSLDQVRQTLEQSQSCCASLNQRLASLEWTYTRQALALAHIEKNTVLAPYEEYLTHKYYTSLYPVRRFTTAQAVCDALGGYLAEIGGSGENQAVIDILKHGPKPLFPAYFLGGQDLIQENQWIWVNSNTRMNFTSWIPGQPDNLANEDCLEIWPSHWKWNDIACKRIAVDRGFLCEVL
ncbi:neurogenic locus notch homolog protein 1 [Elysia marginata]|uniref:Neurogenic locus notch homolog protein 1 n=1 Tax=Elysia marginata TaxID=1093978 RepID=A0AAV4GNZ8_9GAST|nr:neurogenic locus notch homolog protein 1 [Elysia marginata]